MVVSAVERRCWAGVLSGAASFSFFFFCFLRLDSSAAAVLARAVDGDLPRRLLRR